ncbi:hypothetical protein MGG_17522 [Pyricularia oryzae 70-15]|uniref:Secreted protein n=5 Tax=Pyricularia TaxID=48558 RepID=A0ABQ8NN88_PYRGI|nr:uncharacterized protein MGG_17522 [Pyricularia oryzae 70-15]ELQ41581.1 hypothetical protein OOU_Y34scaffold00267g18 [Pyricularia oryzae Y34]KAH8841327.1 hypothetical protein MCOR01_007996 [Pyricularia oryzae]KAI6299554.1 hypothetical protein MCOR33_004569 [Pyricularia grisea]EHA49394.1 hypothetical protein MGG_17522 [Pyricularia oryzae 70-15]KAI6259712.1 hypothetical protein MCOR19_003960 [Pyricularia oryzae]
MPETVVLLALSLKHLAVCTCPTKPHTPLLSGTKGRTSVATSSANDLYNNRCSLLKGVQRFGVVRSFIGAVLSFLSPR